MAKRKRAWKDLATEERGRAVLSACSRARTTESLATYLGTEPRTVELVLVELREGGLVRCTDKHWYRSDLPIKLPAPRPPPGNRKAGEVSRATRELVS